MTKVHEIDAFTALEAGADVFREAKSNAPAVVTDSPLIFPPWFEREMVRIWTAPPRNNVINDRLIAEWNSIARMFTAAMNDKMTERTAQSVALPVGRVVSVDW